MTSFWNKAAAEAAQRQSQCDVVQADFRSEAKPSRIRRDALPVPEAVTPTDDPLMLRLAEELEYSRRMLDALGDSLSSDPLIVKRHVVAMQSLDIVGQMLGHLAEVIRSSDVKGAVERIGMSDLKARLTRQSTL